jgi:light-regulated signal transduction histidine kinase (bacteriophytochrome)
LKIHEAADFISEEKWDHRISVKGRDEVSEVAQAFNNMARRLGESYAALEVEIGERKKVEKELLRSNTDLEEFAHIASHDLKEPLRKVRAFGEMLTMKCSESLSEEGRDYLGRMHHATGRKQDLLDSLLSYSRVMKKPRSLARIDLNESVREAISNLEVMIREKQAVVDVEQLPTVLADPVQMIQLFQNLIGNALKFQRNGDHPHVRIYAHPKENEEPEKESACGICVEDNGIGFDEKYLDKIFVPFQRLHGRIEYEGSGIGLAVCRKIAERLGGSITAKSTPGMGSIFKVSLPVEKVGEEHPESDRSNLLFFA